MTAQQIVQNTLNDALLMARIQNPSYSLRAFSKRLSLSPAAVSEILNGKRKVSAKMAERITDQLALDPEKKNAVLEAFKETPESTSPLPTSTPLSPRESLELSQDHFKLISEWYHYAILSLAETRGFHDDASAIAERLGIRTQDAEKAIERLGRIGLLKRLPSGRLKPTGVNCKSPDDIAMAALRHAHFKNLELAKKSLEEDPVDVRDFTSMTMAIDPSKVPIAKKMIRNFMEQLCYTLESGQKSEVYQYCVQLLPLTKTPAKKPQTHPRPKPSTQAAIESPQNLETLQ